MAQTRPTDLMVVTAELGGKVVREDLAQLAKISGDIDGVAAALAEQVGEYAWWSTLVTLAADEEQTAKDALDALEADLLDRIGDKGTVTAAKAKMKQDPRWTQLHDAWRAKQGQAAMIRNGLKTVEHRATMLRELRELMCAEMVSGLGRFGRRPDQPTPSAEAAARAHQEQQARFGRKTTR